MLSRFARVARKGKVAHPRAAATQHRTIVAASRFAAQNISPMSPFAGTGTTSSSSTQLGERIRRDGAPHDAPYKDTVYAEHLMTPYSQNNVLSVRRTASVEEATVVMNENNVGCLVVIDDWESVIGIFTERDYIEKIVSKGADPALTPVSSVMTSDPTCANVRDTLDRTVKTMVDLHCRHVPVLGRKHQESVQDKDNPPHSKAIVGMISISDVTHKLVELNDGMNVSNWDVAKAAAWISSLGDIYKKYADNFAANQVDGDVLLKFVDADSIEDLVDVKLHQRVVLGALAHLKAQNSGEGPGHQHVLTAEHVLQQRRDRRGEPIPVVSVKSTDSVYDAVQQLVQTGVGATLVRDGDFVMGIVTERDYLRMADNKRPLTEIPVSEIMTTDLATVNVQNTVDEMLSLMAEAGVRHVPIFETGADLHDGSKCLGILSSKDVLRTLYLS